MKSFPEYRHELFTGGFSLSSFSDSHDASEKGPGMGDFGWDSILIDSEASSFRSNDESVTTQTPASSPLYNDISLEDSSVEIADRKDILLVTGSIRASMIHFIHWTMDHEMEKPGG